jgi:hypothetical protein
MTDIKAALGDLLNAPDLPLDDAIERHFLPTYSQRTDGICSDRSGFATHIAHLRSIIASVSIEVLDEFRDGTRYADRHIVDVAKTDGGRVTQEVYLFGELADDGRFAHIDETTLMLDGDETDRNIGSVH